MSIPVKFDASRKIAADLLICILFYSMICVFTIALIILLRLGVFQ